MSNINIIRDKDKQEHKQLYCLNYLSRKSGCAKEVHVYASSKEKAWEQLDKTEVVKRLKKPRKNINDIWE